MKQKIVFFGSSKHVLPVIEVLKNNFDLELVITTEEGSSETVPSFCIKNNITYISVSSLKDPGVKSRISNLKSELAVLGYFGLLVPDEILDIFSKGIINFHPSLLPKYRGPTPIQTALLNGDKKTGLSIILLDEEVDHGPILWQKEEEILDKDTSEDLYSKLFLLGATQLRQITEQYVNGNLKPTPQDHKKASFTERLTKEDGYIDINNPPEAEKIRRMIKAYFPWPGVWFICHSEQSEESNLEGKILKLLPDNKIQVEGKKPMNYKDFANGYTEGEQILKKLNLI